jgi:choline monooxygenase
MPLDDARLSDVLKPIASATGLPNEAYTDPAWFAEEKRKVFFEGWAAIGFGFDAPDPGDAVPMEFLGVPLLLVRDKKGTLRVFQNVCRHRGMILVDEPTKIKGVIRCPYHAWCYGMDGALRTTPDVGGPGIHDHVDVVKSELGLMEVRSHIWKDAIFVNLSGTAAPFEEHAAELMTRWAEFDQPIHFGGADSTFELTINANWKLAIENTCESYHLPSVHPGLNSYSRIEDHYHIESPTVFAGQGTTVYAPTLDQTGRAFADFKGLSEKWDKGAEYIALFPNIQFGVSRDHFFAILLIPTGEGQTRERIALYYADPAMQGDDYADLRALNAKQWRSVFLEDIGVVEGMYRGRSAPGFDGGHFSPVMDSPTYVFHQWVAGKMVA